MERQGEKNLHRVGLGVVLSLPMLLVGYPQIEFHTLRPVLDPRYTKASGEAGACPLWCGGAFPLRSPRLLHNTVLSFWKQGRVFSSLFNQHRTLKVNCSHVTEEDSLILFLWTTTKPLSIVHSITPCSNCCSLLTKQNVATPQTTKRTNHIAHPTST